MQTDHTAPSYQVGTRVRYVNDRRERMTGRIVGVAKSMFGDERVYTIRPDDGSKDIELFPHTFTPVK